MRAPSSGLDCSRKTLPRRGPSRLRQALLYLFVIAGSFAIYMSNAQTLASYDSAPNSLLAFNLFENHRFDLDLFRGSYFAGLGGQYAFVEAPNGHLTSAYPIGPALVSLPIYCVFYLAARDRAVVPAINAPAFEPFRQRYEKTAAAILAALSVALFLLCARQIGNFAQAAIATAVYALATSMWSTGSQALWQHGPVNILLLAMFFALVRAVRARARANVSWWLAGAGICAGLLPVVRPTAILFTVAAALFVTWAMRSRGVLFFVGLAFGIAPGVAWNLYFFHALSGGYGGVANPYVASAAYASTAFAGLLVSPSRGLFTFSPVLIFSLIGIVVAGRRRDRPASLVVLLAMACAALVLQYAFSVTGGPGMPTARVS
jgi:hypothetical protein